MQAAFGHWSEVGANQLSVKRPSRGLAVFAAYRVSPEFGIDRMILRWRPDDGKSWNLGSITSPGEVLMDSLGQRAKNAALPEEHKQYLAKLVDLVPNAHVKKTNKETAWFVAQNGKIITIDLLVADQSSRNGWLDAIKEFQ
jgi:hypothetical protein